MKIKQTFKKVKEGLTFNIDSTMLYLNLMCRIKNNKSYILNVNEKKYSGKIKNLVKIALEQDAIICVSSSSKKRDLWYIACIEFGSTSLKVVQVLDEQSLKGYKEKLLLIEEGFTREEVEKWIKPYCTSYLGYIKE